MIESVEIRGWQSLANVQLAFGRFTVIVGASSSGKSALIRAMKSLASNVRGTAPITRGATAAAITARLGEHGIVTLEHVAGSWQYRLSGVVEPFVRLNGRVPTEVTERLRIAPVPTAGTSINFAGQFDKPYLVDETGGTVARDLGDLTNVNRILAAVAEGHRQRKQLAATLRTRQADLDEHTARAATFASLPARLAACDAAERLAATLTVTRSRVERLQGLTEALRGADDALAAVPAVAIPDDGVLCDLLHRRDALLGLLREYADAVGTAHQHETLRAKADHLAAETDAAIHRVLVEAGTCPTCGQTVTR